jgi:PAS domain S-box-containing protein
MNKVDPLHEKLRAMNKALMVGVLRQHEFTAAANALNVRLSTEIEEHKRADARVRVSETRYRRLFETAHDGILLVDPDTRKIVDANPLMTKLIGYSRRQLIGKELFEIGLLKDEVASQKMFRKLRGTHEVRYEDLPLKSHKGRHQEVEVVACLYKEGNHQVIQCNVRDITERKRQEMALSQLAAIVAFSRDAIIGEDPRGIVTSWNEGAMRIFGYTADEIVGKPVMRLVPQAQRREEMRFMEKIRAGESVEHFETKRKTRSGRIIDVSLTLSPITDNAGRIVGASKVARDITALKRQEAALLRVAKLTATNRKLEREAARRLTVEKSLRGSQRQLKRSHVQLKRLAQAAIHGREEERLRISHDLHDRIMQILLGINIRLATLSQAKDVSEPAFKRNVAITRRLVQQSVETVHDFARELRPDLLDELGFIPAINAFLKKYLRETGIRARLTVYAEVETLGVVTLTTLFRIAQEALTNVARHAKAHSVHIGVRKLPGMVRMTIKDNGVGFDMAAMAAGKKSERIGMVGMRERAEMIGGTFIVRSAKNLGTAITVRVPLPG